MRLEKLLDDYRYTLTSDGLKEGDRVYPIVNGRVQDDGTFIIHDIEFRSTHFDLNTSGFPDEPHIIEDIKHSDYKPYQVRTDHGYSPIERYFKIEKIEKRCVTKRESGPLVFTDVTWEVVGIKETIDEMIAHRKIEESEDEVEDEELKIKYRKIPIHGYISLGMYPVYCDDLYWGHEPFKIVGIRENKIEIEGDFSGGTHNVTQRDWIDVEKVFVVTTVCVEQIKPGGCQVHNVNCCGGGSVIEKHERYWENLID
jgi:hypothetical protein